MISRMKTDKITGTIQIRVTKDNQILLLGDLTDENGILHTKAIYVHEKNTIKDIIDGLTTYIF